MILLAIDIGNTQITFGVFTRTKKNQTDYNLQKSWRLQTFPHSTSDEYGLKIQSLLNQSPFAIETIEGIILASVVPSLTSVFSTLSQNYFNQTAKIVQETIHCPIENLYNTPQEVGADRIVNSFAAYHRVKSACVVVDFGTATTFDCITSQGAYSGGLIVPGPLLAAESLARHTAKLPKASIEKPVHLIGKTSLESIQSGLYYGYNALVDGILTRLEKEMDHPLSVLATGGLASLISKDSQWISDKNIVPNLTLEGLAKIFLEESNR